MSIEQIKPHGGKLINRIIDHNSKEKYQKLVPSMTKISISLDRAKEIDNLASAYSR
jgi:ATP sulfurylase